jgi:hypothetical protein
MSDDTYEPLPEWVPKVRAIGIDTNALGKGGYHGTQLRELARQAKQHGELEIWIAEPVVWEWAEHLHKARTEFNAQRTSLKDAGIEVAAQPAEIQDSLQHVEAAISTLGDHVRIISIEAVAHEALKDQVLVRSPGERVYRNASTGATSNGKKLKTGAADSAIYRAYHHQARGNGDSYVILSSDSDVAKAHEAWGLQVRTFKQRRHLNDELFRMIQAPGSLVKECVSFLMSNLDQLDLTSFRTRTSLGGWDSEDRIVSFAAIGSKLLVGLSRPKLDRKAQLVTAEACIVTDVLASEFTYDLNGEGLQLPGNPRRTYPDAALYLDVTFSVDKGIATGVSMGAVRFASVNEIGEEIRDDDGPSPILENMTTVPGMAAFEWAESFYEDSETTIHVDGDLLHLNFSGNAITDWTLTATYREHAVEISGVQQHDGQDFGDIIFPGTVRLYTDSDLVPNHPSLAINALVLNTPRAASGLQ